MCRKVCAGSAEEDSSSSKGGPGGAESGSEEAPVGSKRRRVEASSSDSLAVQIMVPDLLRLVQLKMLIGCEDHRARPTALKCIGTIAFSAIVQVIRLCRYWLERIERRDASLHMWCRAKVQRLSGYQFNLLVISERWDTLGESLFDAMESQRSRI